MSTLTKVFAVLLVVVCIAFSMSVTQFLVTSENEKEGKQKAQAEAAVERTALIAAGVDHRNIKSLLSDERKRGISAANTAQTELTRRDMQIGDQLTQISDLRAKLTTAQANTDNALKLVTQTTKLYQQITQQVSDLRAEVDKQVQIATGLRDEQRNLVREIDGWRFRAERLNKQIRDLTDRNREMRARLVEGTGRVASAGRGGSVVGEVGRNVVGGSEPLYGRVKSVSKDLAVISVGEDDGVSKGMKFLVFRGEKLLATFVADRVEPQETAGMLINVKAKIKGGDNVLSNSRLF